jgi:MoxR-like ATPase
MVDISSKWTTVPRDDPARPVVLPPPITEKYRAPQGYDPSPDLIAAINVALLLGQPLLLTGEPGCGKTSVGYWLAWQLGLGEPLVHNVKSTSNGRELLYDFDELARFRAAQARVATPAESFLRLNALGRAIVLSRPADEKLPGPDGLTNRHLTYTLWPRDADRTVLDQNFERRHVVLIDELDKAPRDTPNDLLLELERMEFRIPELGTEVTGNTAHRPVVVITSNSERVLPEPFLRRCVFHHIQAPDARRRQQIINRRNPPFAERVILMGEAMDFFERLRGELGRTPGTSELLAWLDALENQVRRAEATEGRLPASIKGLVEPTLGVLAKTKEDLERAVAVMTVANLR